MEFFSTSITVFLFTTSMLWVTEKTTSHQGLLNVFCLVHKLWETLTWCVFSVSKKPQHCCLSPSSERYVDSDLKRKKNNISTHFFLPVLWYLSADCSKLVKIVWDWSLKEIGWYWEGWHCLPVTTELASKSWGRKWLTSTVKHTLSIIQRKYRVISCYSYFYLLRYWYWANILWLTDTFAHLFWISWCMLQSNFSNLLGGRVDFFRIMRIQNQYLKQNQVHNIFQNFICVTYIYFIYRMI